MEDKLLYWFAAKTKPRQEKFIKDKLNGLAIENFIPLRMELRQWKYRKKKVIVPVIPQLNLSYTKYASGFQLLNENRLHIWYMKDLATNRNLIVPDKQMEDFMMAINAKKGNMRIINPDLAKGDKVVVKGGPFKGLEGELLRVEEKSRVVVNLQGIIAVSVEIEGQFLEKI